MLHKLKTLFKPKPVVEPETLKLDDKILRERTTRTINHRGVEYKWSANEKAYVRV
jgi:hypothetical protein